MRLLLFLYIAAGLIGCAGTPATTAPSSDGKEAAKLASQAYAQGRFEDAAVFWRQAAIEHNARKDLPAEIDARANLASAQMMLGRYDLAVTSLMAALESAEQAGDRRRRATILNSLGAAYTFNPKAGERPGNQTAERSHTHHGGDDRCAGRSQDPAELFAQALSIAEELKDRNLQASILNNWGNYNAKSGAFELAIKDYSRVVELVSDADAMLAAKAQVNGAIAALTAAEKETQTRRGERIRTCVELNGDGQIRLEKLPNSHEKSFLLLTVGQTAEQLAKLDEATAAAQLEMARKAYEQALAVAEAQNDLRSRSYACGFLGGLYLQQKNIPRAEEMTRRAIAAAQQARLPDSLYRWQWQNARLLRQKYSASKSSADLDSSIAFYDAAVETVRFIRNDISLGHGNQRKRVSFRESIGSLYFEYADMLLQRADLVKEDAKKSEEVAKLYLKARDTVERVKAVELENYFQDECVHLLKQKQKDVEDVDAQTAVIYLIPLAERTEILVSFRGGQFYRPRPSELSSDRLARLAELFRRQISSQEATDDYDGYRRTGNRLYQFLIEPIRAELARRGITTLVFVPDGPLRTIPMAALWDGQKHLVESFAVAVTPGLELLEPRSIQRVQVQLLTSGLSEKREGFAALTYVPTELDNLQKLYPGATRLQDKDFIKPQIEKALQTNPYSIVHVASHAYFGKDASESFLLTYDGRLTLDEIERLIRPYQLRDQPVELLTLSACQTAEGDPERAALGLAGIAVKAGARSAVATLWSVNEKASVDLMAEFYRELGKGSGSLKEQVSKARAMQDAQIKLISGQEFDHPYYWAPFLIIGNWL